MTDKAVISLARAAGIRVDWTDADGKPRRVQVETLRCVLAALGYPATSKQDIAHSRATIAASKQELPALLVAKPGAPIDIGSPASHVRVELETGERREAASSAVLRAPSACGYHTLQLGDRRHVLAVVPDRCFAPDDVRPGKRFCGVTVQIPSLRGGSTEGFGDFEALAELASDAGALGVDAVLLSPAHAQFGARPERFNPYAPSSRLFLNALLAGLSGPAESARHDALIDWRKAGPAKLAALRALFKPFDQSDARFRSFCRTGGGRLLHHALFEALDCHFRAHGVPDASRWPDAVRDPDGPAVTKFARENQPEVRFALFQQWLAARSLARVHARARETMAIGLIADIAVGVDPNGSHAWSSRAEMLGGLRIGAPPDAFNAAGQNWGLTSFSPGGLRQTGYAGFLETLRASMRYAGGIRIDHAMSLERLWVLPEGAQPGEGAYLTYPRKELLALLALESIRNRVIVIGEDLGTVPRGFRAALAKMGILGMQILWFQHDRRGGYAAPEDWRKGAIAMTTTHDLPTVAGWWGGRDIAWQERLGLASASALRHAKSGRNADRRKLWSAFAKEGVAGGKPPPSEKPDAAVHAALAFVARTRCQLAIAPLEDFVAAVEQPNIPGTIEEHPNWRRRLRERAPLRDRRAIKRVQAFVAARDET